MLKKHRGMAGSAMRHHGLSEDVWLHVPALGGRTIAPFVTVACVLRRRSCVDPSKSSTALARIYLPSSATDLYLPGSVPVPVVHRVPFERLPPGISALPFSVQASGHCLRGFSAAAPTLWRTVAPLPRLAWFNAMPDALQALLGNISLARWQPRYVLYQRLALYSPATCSPLSLLTLFSFTLSAIPALFFSVVWLIAPSLCLHCIAPERTTQLAPAPPPRLSGCRYLPRERTFTRQHLPAFRQAPPSSAHHQTLYRFTDGLSFCCWLVPRGSTGRWDAPIALPPCRTILLVVIFRISGGVAADAWVPALLVPARCCCLHTHT